MVYGGYMRYKLTKIRWDIFSSLLNLTDTQCACRPGPGLVLSPRRFRAFNFKVYHRSWDLDSFLTRVNC